MTDTATKILDAGQFLIQTRGYSAVSFQDIATKVGIKKPSIIHHFENKCSLGVAIIQRYRSNFAEQLEAIKNDPQNNIIVMANNPSFYKTTTNFKKFILLNVMVIQKCSANMNRSF